MSSSSSFGDFLKSNPVRHLFPSVSLSRIVSQYAHLAFLYGSQHQIDAWTSVLDRLPDSHDGMGHVFINAPSSKFVVDVNVLAFNSDTKSSERFFASYIPSEKRFDVPSRYTIVAWQFSKRV